jgi:DNA-binding transcriptional ArsR family regulator
MENKPDKTMKASGRDQKSALASPLRLEIIGLFTSTEPLAIADMARLMGRAAGSLYHHVGILEKAGLLKRVGTRPKGKRHEALFQPAASRIEMDGDDGGEDSAQLAVKTMAAAFRMAERDLEAALTTGDFRQEGPARNLLATRVHMRVPPKVLARINEHLKALEDLLTAESVHDPEPSSGDQYLSLTLALLPLKGRVSPGQEEGK